MMAGRNGSVGGFCIGCETWPSACPGAPLEHRQFVCPLEGRGGAPPPGAPVPGSGCKRAEQVPARGAPLGGGSILCNRLRIMEC
jgi:hypothetical protein